MKYKTLILSLLIVAGTIIPLTTAHGQSPTPVVPSESTAQAKPEMTVTPAFDGYFKYGEWLPLSIDLENSGQDIEAEVRVRVPRANGGVTFTAPVSLPSGAHKLVTLFILPNNYSHSLDVDLVSNGKVLVSKKAAMNPMMNINIIIGLVTPERGALSLLNGLQYPNNQRPVQVVDVNLWQLPEQMEGLRSFDVLIFNAIDTSKLTPGQTASLAAWVQLGGRLIFGGGAGAELTLSGIPADLLPVKLDGKQNISSDGLDELVSFAKGQEIKAAGEFVVNKTVLTNSLVLAGTSDLPLVSERSNGRGYVDFVALDLSSSPFEGWSSTERFWETLLRTSEDFFNQPTDVSQRSIRASMMSNPLTMIPSMELPSIKWLAAILAVYILIVGPVNYLLLKKKNRLHWAWFTIPGVTILFSGAAFGGGYLMKGNDILIHKIGVLEIQPGGSALVSSYMGLFSPSQKSYQVEVPGGSLLSPIMDENLPYNIAGPGSEITLIQGKPSILKGLTVNQWSMQSFMTEETISDFGRISGDLKIEDGKLVGTVQNGLKQVLKDTTLIMRNQFIRLGDLNPGQEVEVTLNFSSDLALRGMPVYYRIYENNMGDLSTPERSLIDLKRAILSPLFDNQIMFKINAQFVGGGGGGGFVGGGGGGGSAGGENIQTEQDVMVIGWVDQVPPDISVFSEKTAVQTLGLVYDYLTYKLPVSGEINFPPGILQGRLIKSDAGPCGPMDSINFFFDKGMEAQVEYRLPTPESYQYTQLDLRLATDGPAGTALPDVALYDWQAEKWSKFPGANFGINIIKEPERYIGSNGEVQLQFGQENAIQMGGCTFVDLGFHGAGKGGAK